MSNTRPAACEKQHSVRKALLLGCMVALFGAACGQRGPLYLPQPEPQPESQPAAPPAESATAAETADDAGGEAEESEDSASEEEDDE